MHWPHMYIWRYQPVACTEPADFGHLAVTDRLSGEVVFAASSVWRGTGTMSVPRQQSTEEMRQLRTRGLPAVDP